MTPSPRWRLVNADALAALSEIPPASVDAVVTDPPYPEIDRPYGRMTEAEWADLMHAVVLELRRVLTSTGSAVLVLQANQERVGTMRAWLPEFEAWCCRQWNVVQDAYWWNHATPPTVHASRRYGLMRPSVKRLVWLGAPDCYRNQDAVLWAQSDSMKAKSREDMALQRKPSGQSVRVGRFARTVDERGGTTPFNLLPIANTDSSGSSGARGHGAGTPVALCRWWVRYLCPVNGLVLDPFHGAGSVGEAALIEGRRVLGIERDAGYHASATARLAAVAPGLPFGAP